MIYTGWWFDLQFSLYSIYTVYSPCDFKLTHVCPESIINERWNLTAISAGSGSRVSQSLIAITHAWTLFNYEFDEIMFCIVFLPLLLNFFDFSHVMWLLSYRSHGSAAGKAFISVFCGKKQTWIIFPGSHFTTFFVQKAKNYLFCGYCITFLSSVNK